jgi:hypothetical protein
LFGTPAEFGRLRNSVSVRTPVVCCFLVGLGGGGGVPRWVYLVYTQIDFGDRVS